MSTHNIGFYKDLTKIIFELSSNSSAVYDMFSHCKSSVPKSKNQSRTNGPINAHLTIAQV